MSLDIIRFSRRIDPGFDGLGGRFGCFADEALRVEAEGAVEGFLPCGMDGVGLASNSGFR